MNALSLREETIRDLVSRLKKTEGQARGILRMIETNSDCSDILIQISALSAASRRIGALIIQGCLEECSASLLQRQDKDLMDKKVQDMAQAISRFIAIR